MKKIGVYIGRNIFPCLIVVVLSSTVLIYSKRGDYFHFSLIINTLTLLIGLLGSAALIHVIFKTIKKGKLNFRVLPVDITVLAWFAYNLAGTYRNQIHNEKIIVFLSCVCFYFLLRILLKKNRIETFENKVVFGITILSIYETIVGLLQFYGLIIPVNDLFQITGTFRNPTHLSLFLACIYPISFVIYFFHEKSNLRSISIYNLILTLWVAIIAENRASWIAITLVSMIILEIKYKFFRQIITAIKTSWWRVSVGFFFGAFIIISLAFFIFNYKPVSANARLLVWEVSLKKSSNDPLLGQGYGSFFDNYTKWQVSHFEINPLALSKTYFGNTSVSSFAGYVKVAYNEYIEIVVEQGLIGLGLFLALIGITVWQSVKCLNKKFIALFFAYLCSFLSILIMALFSYPFSLGTISTFAMFFAFLALISNRYQKVKVENFSSFSSRSKPFIIITFLLVLVIYSFTYAINNFRLSNLYGKAIGFSKENNSKKAEFLYHELFEKFKDNSQFLLEYSISLINNGKLEEAAFYLTLAKSKDFNPTAIALLGDVSMQLKKYQQAEDNYKILCLIFPSRIYPKYLLVKLYQENNKVSEAKKLAKLIIETKLKVSNDLSDQIIDEMNSLIRE